MAFRQITIFGVGLLGGSLGLAARRRGIAETVVGVGHRESTLRTASQRGAIDRWTLDPAEGVRGSDLVVLATPVGLFAPLIEQAAAALEPGSIVTDVGSTKREVMRTVTPLMPKHCAFVGSHPMAGSEARGIDAAREDLYDGALVLVVPDDGSDTGTEEAAARVEALWQAVGAQTRRIGPEEHDRLLALSSHLPHLAASALAASITGEAAEVAATGFLDTTRVASGDPAMWRDIVMTNAGPILEALDAFEGVLDRLRQAIAAGDAEAVFGLLDEAKQQRDRIVEARDATT